MYGVGGGGGGAAASWQRSCGGFVMGGEMTSVFTASQRQELETQILIYTHIAASMPVPLDPLIHMSYPAQLQLSSYQYNNHGNSSGMSAFHQRYATGSRDSEPWRCRRTDGKKWRCARDVAPNKKCCEWHSRKRKSSRSRKHVKLSSASSSSSTSNAPKNNNDTFIQPSTSSAANITKPSFLFHPSQSMFISHHPQNPAENNHSRLPELFMKSEAHDQSTASPFFLPHANELDPFHRATHTSSMTNNHHQSHFPTALPRQFLDEWSFEPEPDSSLLTLSMVGGSGVHSSEDEAAQLSQRYSWMGSYAPGGPLAEALCLGIVGTDREGSRGMNQGHGETGGTTKGPRFNKWFD